MPKVVKNKRENISGTIDSKYKEWLSETSLKKNIPQSQLLEEGIILLKKHIREEENKQLEKEIKKGINMMLLNNENQVDLSESGFSDRVGEELL